MVGGSGEDGRLLCSCIRPYSGAQDTPLLPGGPLLASVLLKHPQYSSAASEGVWLLAGQQSHLQPGCCLQGLSLRAARLAPVAGKGPPGSPLPGTQWRLPLPLRRCSPGSIVPSPKIRLFAAASLFLTVPVTRRLLRSFQPVVWLWLGPNKTDLCPAV